MFSLSFLTSHCFFDANLRIIDKTADRRGHFFPLQATKSFAERKKPLIFAVLKARMAELVDALDSKIQRPQGCAGSTPAPGTPYQRPCNLVARLFCFPLLTYPTRDKPPSHFPKSHPSKFRLPPLPAQYRLRTPLPTGSSLYPAQHKTRRLPVQYLLNAFPVCINTKNRRPEKAAG